MAIVEALEGGVLDLPDFYFTADDYTYRFDPEAKQGFLDLLRERFNSGVRYKGRALKWDTVIEQKSIELGRFQSWQEPIAWSYGNESSVSGSKRVRGSESERAHFTI